mmetsp:Transcript_96303/g.272260  ORF Transcript_96303/g.272260 Transcript_96303/m.272260 type:complete len:302 (+) Transcript_96303:653-1558(+)
MDVPDIERKVSKYFDLGSFSVNRQDVNHRPVTGATAQLYRKGSKHEVVQWRASGLKVSAAGDVRGVSHDHLVRRAGQKCLVLCPFCKLRPIRETHRRGVCPRARSHHLATSERLEHWPRTRVRLDADAAPAEAKVEVGSVRKVIRVRRTHVHVKTATLPLVCVEHVVKQKPVLSPLAHEAVLLARPTQILEMEIHEGICMGATHANVDAAASVHHWKINLLPVVIGTLVLTQPPAQCRLKLRVEVLTIILVDAVGPRVDCATLHVEERKHKGRGIEQFPVLVKRKGRRVHGPRNSLARPPR